MTRTHAPLVCLLALLISSPVIAEAPFDQPIPKPTGSFGVGTAVWHWPDPSRPDEVTRDPGDVREIMAQAWYPVDAKAAQTTKVYAPLDHGITHATGWSQPGAPFSAKIGKAPVIALCPGRGMPRYFYTSVAEDLASHGYVVLALDSPHLGNVHYPDGRHIPPDILAGPEVRTSFEAFDDFWEKNAVPGIADVRFALRSFERIGAEDPARRLTGKLDWTRLGAFGHSLGTRTCGGAVLADPRFAAFAAMDGPLPRDARKRGVDAALLMMLSGNPGGLLESVRESVSSRRADAHLLFLESFGHGSVTDLPFLEPGKHPGRVDPLAGLERTREILRTFFDQYVKKTGAGTSALSRLPEARMESFPKPRQ